MYLGVQDLGLKSQEDAWVPLDVHHVQNTAPRVVKVYITRHLVPSTWCVLEEVWVFCSTDSSAAHNNQRGAVALFAQ